MKLSILSLMILMFSMGAEARQILKCTSVKNGTIWASFGRMWESGKAEPQAFPTEIVVFGPDYSARNVYTLADALKVPVNDREASMSLEFSVTAADNQVYKHHVQVMIAHPSDPNGFAGNWKATRASGEESIDFTACSIF